MKKTNIKTTAKTVVKTEEKKKKNPWIIFLIILLVLLLLTGGTVLAYNFVPGFAEWTDKHIINPIIDIVAPEDEEVEFSIYEDSQTHIVQVYYKVGANNEILPYIMAYKYLVNNVRPICIHAVKYSNYNTKTWSSYIFSEECHDLIVAYLPNEVSTISDHISNYFETAFSVAPQNTTVTYTLDITGFPELYWLIGKDESITFMTTWKEWQSSDNETEIFNDVIANVKQEEIYLNDRVSSGLTTEAVAESVNDKLQDVMSDVPSDNYGNFSDDIIDVRVEMRVENNKLAIYYDGVLYSNSSYNGSNIALFVQSELSIFLMDWRNGFNGSVWQLIAQGIDYDVLAQFADINTVSCTDSGSLLIIDTANSARDNNTVVYNFTLQSFVIDSEFVQFCIIVGVDPNVWTLY